VILADVTAGNGVIHVLNEVLFPKWKKTKTSNFLSKLTEESNVSNEGVESALRRCDRHLFADVLVFFFTFKKVFWKSK